MTVTEFNEKYEKYIEPNFEGLEFENDLVINFLDHLFETKLINIPNFNFAQIKLKYNSCRFYSNISVFLCNYIEHTIDNLLLLDSELNSWQINYFKLN